MVGLLGVALVLCFASWLTVHLAITAELLADINQTAAGIVTNQPAVPVGSVVYFGGNVLFKSTDYGMSWTPISGDLSTNDPAKQQSSGGPIVVDNTAAEFHCTILTIAPSPLDSNVIWVGTAELAKKTGRSCASRTSAAATAKCSLANRRS